MNIELSAILPDTSGFQQTIQYQHNKTSRREIFVGRDLAELERAVIERVHELELKD